MPRNSTRGWTMRAVCGLVASMAMASLVTGCGGTVNYNPANGDATPPTVNLLITRPGAPDVEVQGQSGPSANKSTNFGPLNTTTQKDFSVLATAKDPESGIKDLKITMMRTVCFTSGGGGNNSAPFGTVTRKEAHWSDPKNAPTNPSLGETGIIDARAWALDPANRSETNLLVFRNAQGNLLPGIGVATKWGVEATNFAGLTTFSDVIRVLAGDLPCASLP